MSLVIVGLRSGDSFGPVARSFTVGSTITAGLSRNMTREAAALGVLCFLTLPIAGAVPLSTNCKKEVLAGGHARADLSLACWFQRLSAIWRWRGSSGIFIS